MTAALMRSNYVVTFQFSAGGQRTVRVSVMSYWFPVADFPNDWKRPGLACCLYPVVSPSCLLQKEGFEKFWHVPWECSDGDDRRLGIKMF